MAGKLEGKVAIVTGASAGIGLATAKRFAEEGAYVFITGRRQPELDAAVKEIGPRAAGVMAHSSDIMDLAHFFDTVKPARVASTCSSLRDLRVHAIRNYHRRRLRQDVRYQRQRHAVRGAAGGAADG
jgi:NAD(P)-dependent dehydrogenase (short-subunit alcohol dehydrogenase family)